MNRRQLLIAACAALGFAVWGRSRSARSELAADADFTRLDRTPAEWQKLLSPAQYDVLFEESTERAGFEPLDHEKRAGTFLCAACYLPLFSSKAKFDSGTGWPSFFQPIAASHIGTNRDFKLLLPRTEYHCARCGGHQGHVFEDGPPPTGLRYCNNGVALRFAPESEPLPELRS